MVSVFVYLARHGETDWNAEGRIQGQIDIPLNEVGRCQAEELAERLSGCGATRVIASDLARARETAEIVASRLEAELEIDPELRERMLGVFEGKNVDQCARLHESAWAAYRTDPARPAPGGEPYDAFVERSRRAVLAVARRTARPGSPAVIVAHGGVLRAVIKGATRTPGGPLIMVPNGALYRLLVDEDGLVLKPDVR